MGNICNPCNPSTQRSNDFIESYEKSQRHVKDALDECSDPKLKWALKDEMNSVDPVFITKLYNDLVVNAKAEDDGQEGELEQIEKDLVFSVEGKYDAIGDLLTHKDFGQNEDEKELGQYLEKGLELIKNGKVSVVILAGG